MKIKLYEIENGSNKNERYAVTVSKGGIVLSTTRDLKRAATYGENEVGTVASYYANKRKQADNIAAMEESKRPFVMPFGSDTQIDILD